MGERYSSVSTDQYGPMAVATASGGYSSGIPHTINVSYTDFFGKGHYVRSQVWQTNNSSLVLDGASIWRNITFALITPDTDV